MNYCIFILLCVIANLHVISADSEPSSNPSSKPSSSSEPTSSSKPTSSSEPTSSPTVTPILQTCYAEQLRPAYFNKTAYQNDAEPLIEGTFLNIPRFLFAGQSNMIGHSKHNRPGQFSKIVEILDSKTHKKMGKMRKLRKELIKGIDAEAASVREMSKLVWKLRKSLKKPRILYGTNENAICSYTNPSKSKILDCERKVSPVACGGRSRSDGKGEFGPELMFAHRFPKLNTKFKGQQVGIVKVAVGGSEISHWVDESGPKYYMETLMQKIVAARGTMEAFVWFQGENDYWAQTSHDDYLRDLMKIVAQVREKIYSEAIKYDNVSANFTEPNDVPVVIVQLGPWLYKPDVIDIMTAQQEFVAR